MIVLDLEQGTPQWLAARVGLPTASSFDKILTPKTRKASSSAEKYLHQLLAEWLIGRPLDESISQFMERGTALEESAVAFYQFENEVQVEKVGFVLRDDGKVGCSPDRLVGTNGLLEIKCPGLTTHVGYLLDENGLENYICQTQGQLWITEREWIDILSYNPDLPPALMRYSRDEAFIAALASEVDRFVARLGDAKERLLALGCVPVEPMVPEKIATGFAGVP